jgi:glutathione-regulated potassium-efflux system ancillary protein KefF
LICVVFAHPYPGRSRANRALARALQDLPDTEIRSLYDLYPDFDIDAAAEQAALERTRLVVWMHPLYWYSVPALLKHWFDQVLAPGWAYGEGGTALRGKRCLWVATTGADASAYSAQGAHRLPFDSFAWPIRQTATFCGMRWEEPFVLHGAHRLSDEQLAREAQRLRERIERWRAAGAPAGPGEGAT